MERKDLIELGIENETVDKIMEMHGKTVNPLKQTNESLKAEVDSYKEQVTDRDNQLEEIKSKVGDTDALNVTIESLKQANKDKDDAHQAKMKQVQLDYEVTLALNKANARNEKAVKALLDLDTVKINEDGQLIGLSEQLSNLQETDSYLLILKRSKRIRQTVQKRKTRHSIRATTGVMMAKKLHLKKSGKPQSIGYSAKRIRRQLNV